MTQIYFQFKTALESGWKFYVLTPLFGVHWGLQNQTTLFSPKKEGTTRNIRNEQINHNQVLFKKLHHELKLKKKLDFF